MWRPRGAAWTVRSAQTGDRDLILAVVRSAFSSPSHDPHDEIEIVTRTWQLGAAPPGLDLVARSARVVVGHVMAAVGDLSGKPVIGVAPLAVAPASQRKGVGAALMTEVLQRVEEARWPFALLLGDPAYYGRFGFEPAAALGISYGPVGANDPHFLVRRLGPHPVAVGGVYRYCWESELGAAAQEGVP